MIRSVRLVIGFVLAAVLAAPAGGHEIKVFANRLALPEGPGKTTIFLINEEAPASILTGGDRSLDVDGKSGDGPVEGSIRISQGL